MKRKACAALVRMHRRSTVRSSCRQRTACAGVQAVGCRLLRTKAFVHNQQALKLWLLTLYAQQQLQRRRVTIKR